jgi:hypothetical protein
VVTAGGESWHEVVTQVLDVALIFEFSFLYALFRALIIVTLSVLLHSPPFGKIIFSSACHKQTFLLNHISNREIKSEYLY